MKKLIYLMLLIPILVFGQSESEKIIADFQKMSREQGIYIQSPNEKAEPVFQFCEKWDTEISKLDKQINENELESLKSSDNGTIKFIGHLISAKRNNNKEFVLELLNNVTNEKKIFMAWGCNSNESSYSFQMYLLKVLTVKNILFDPSFNLTKDELSILKEKIKKQQKK